jgi:hypothetical protein
VCTHVQGEEARLSVAVYVPLPLYLNFQVCRIKELEPFFQQTPLERREKCNHSSSGLRFVDTYISRDFDVSNMYFYLSAKEWLTLGLHKVEGLLMKLKVSASLV